MVTPAYVGARKEIALTKETTRGTAESHSSGDWQPHSEFDFGPKTEVVVDDAGRGRIESRSQSHVIHEWSDGSIPIYITNENTVAISELIFGGDASGSGTSGDPYAWTLTNTNEHQAYTVHVYDPVKGYLQYPLGMADTVEMEFIHDDYVMVTLGMIAGKEESGSGSSAYSTTEDIFRPEHITIKIADTYAGLGGASAIALQSLNLSINKNVVPFWKLGSTEPDNIINQRIEVSGDFETLYSDNTYRALGLGDGTKAMQIVADDGSKSITIELPRVEFENWNDAEANDSYMTETIEFNAERDDTNGLIKGEVVNS